MRFEEKREYWAACYQTEKFILVETHSGLGMTRGDPLFSPYKLDLTAMSDSLGEVVIRALINSRSIEDRDERKDFFSQEKIASDYKKWIDDLISDFSYKNKKALFSNMKRCGIRCCEGLIIIAPSQHEKLEAWRALGPEQEVKLPADSSEDEIGIGLRLALSRCL